MVEAARQAYVERTRIGHQQPGSESDHGQHRNQLQHGREHLHGAAGARTEHRNPDEKPHQR